MVIIGTIDIIAQLKDLVSQTSQKIKTNLIQLTQPIKNLKTNQTELTESTNKLRNSYFRTIGPMLSIMFFGMAINRAFGTLNKTIKDVYFSAELMNIQFTMFASMTPFLEPLNELFLKMADIFYNLPEPIQGALGGLIFFGGEALSAIGQLGLGLFGLEKAIPIFAKIGSSLIGFLISPAGLVVLAIVAIALAIYLVWKHWDKIRPILEEIWNAIAKGVGNAVEAIKNFLRPIWEELAPRIVSILQWVKEMFNITWNFIKSIVNSVWNNVLKPIGELIIAIILKIGEKLDKYLRPVWETVIGVLKTVWDALGTAISWIWNNIIKPPLDAFIGLLWDIKDVYDRTLGWIAGKVETVTGMFRSAVGKAKAWVESLQGGGRITKTGLALVHAGETVIPAGKAGASIDYHPTFNISAVIEKDIDIRDLARRLDDLTRTDLRRMVI